MRRRLRRCWPVIRDGRGEEAGPDRTRDGGQRPAGRALPARSSTSGSRRSWRTELDEIASGERAWVPTMREFYGPFTETLKRPSRRCPAGQVKDEPSGEDCEKCGRPMVIKLGRYGKFLACSGFPECRNSRPLLREDRRALPDLQAGRRSSRTALEEGPDILRVRAATRVRFLAWNQAGATTTCAACGSYMVKPIVARRRSAVKARGGNDRRSPATAG